MPKDNVIKFSDLQKKQTEKHHRAFDRVLFEYMMGAFAIIDRQGLLRVRVVDLSEGGTRFAMPKSYGEFAKGERLAFRLYFSQQDYIPLYVRVVHKLDSVDHDEMQYGCAFESLSPEVQSCLHHLVAFVQEYVRVAKTDSGDRQVLLR